MPRRSAIIYQNASKTVTLFDIPFSISLTQGTSHRPCSMSIHSCPALEKPWPSTEPKSIKAKANVAAHGMISENSSEEQAFLQNALQELHESWKGDWCLEREIKSDFEEPVTPIFSSENCKSTEGHRSEPSVLRTPPASPLRPCDLHTWPIHNATPDLISLPVEVSFPHNAETRKPYYTRSTYHVPPGATFILSEITNIEDWSCNIGFGMGVLSLLPGRSTTTSAGPGEFDFILLDPPWPNRSARRSKSYHTTPFPLDPLQTILIPHIAPTAIVACWITNSATTRARALEAFEAWDVSLVEEWYWLKVTRDGRPVTDIKGTWRKPHETLLLGQKKSLTPSNITTTTQLRTAINRRVIAAVPDVHSRKPCLKELVEDICGFKEGEYRALEVFARGLVAGWWGWGDECLRFQWGGWWEDDG